MKRTLLLVVFVVAYFAANGGLAQDALAVDTNIHLRTENDRVRVLERTLQPGEREHLHSHPFYITYVVKGGKLRVHRSDGKITETEMKAGDVVYSEPVTHWAENIGTTATQVIMVELKDQPASAPAPAP